MTKGRQALCQLTGFGVDAAGAQGRLAGKEASPIGTAGGTADQASREEKPAEPDSEGNKRKEETNN